MRLSRALQEKIMDVRLRDKLVHEGTVSQEEVKKFLDSLPDETANATWTEVADADLTVEDDEEEV